MTSTLRTRVASVVVAAAVLLAVDPLTHAAVRPPKLNYTMTTLANGLQVVLLEDHSTPIVHAEIWYHVGSKNEKPGRTGFAHLFEHMMFKGSKNVEPEGHPSLDLERRRPEQRLHERRRDGLLADVPGAVPAARALARSRSPGLAAHRREGVPDRARGGQGRAAHARRESAVRAAERNRLRPGVHGPSLQAPDHRQHEGSRGGVDRGRARFLPHLLRPEQRDAGDRRGLRHQGGDRAGGAVPGPRAEVDAPGAARHPEGAAADEGAPGHGSTRTGRCRRSSSRTTSPSTATPTRIRCTSLRRCCRTARARASTGSWSTTSSSRSRLSAAATSSKIRTCSSRWRSCSRAQRPEEAVDALIAELDRLRNEPIIRRGAAAGQEPVRPRLHPQPRVEQGQGEPSRRTPW